MHIEDAEPLVFVRRCTSRTRNHLYLLEGARRRRGINCICLKVHAEDAEPMLEFEAETESDGDGSNGKRKIQQIKLSKYCNIVAFS